MRPERLPLRVGWIFLLSLTWLMVWGVAAQATEVASLIKPAQYQKAPATLDLRIQSAEGATTPPAELLLDDPSGRMSGSDAQRIRYGEIPDSSYRREGDTYHLRVDNPENGRYTLRVIGLAKGKYILYITGYDQTGARAKVQFTRLTEPGVTHIFAIDYSNVAGTKLKARQIRRID